MVNSFKISNLKVKLKTMKQYQFSLKDECMKELPSMEEPVIGDYSVSFGKEHKIDIEVYKEHLASLQSIPVPKKYLNQFKDGKIYNEGDFEINENHRYADGFEKGGSFMDKMAIPKQKLNDTVLNFSDWIKRKHNDLGKAGDGYESLSELSKNCIDYAIKRYIEWIRKQKVEDTELPLLNLGFEIKFIKNERLPANTAMVSKYIYEILKNNYQNK